MQVIVEKLKKYYGDKCVVDNVSFNFKSGEIFCLIGRNGSGKTTTIRMMLGTLSRDSGNVMIDGMNTSEKLNNIGYLSEERGLFVKDTIINQLIYFAMLKGMKKKDALNAAEKWLGKLGILDNKNDKLETLSKGNQQKIQIISSLIHDPDIIIFDEPFSGLDPINTKWFIDLLKDLKNKNKCILISSHQLHLLEEICDSLAIISYSKLVYFGNLNDLKKKEGGRKLYVSFSDNISEEEINSIYYLKKISSNEYVAELTNKINFKNIMSDIVNRGFEINSLQIKDISLNDIFIKLEELR